MYYFIPRFGFNGIINIFVQHFGLFYFYVAAVAIDIVNWTRQCPIHWLLTNRFDAKLSTFLHFHFIHIYVNDDPNSMRALFLIDCDGGNAVACFRNAANRLKTKISPWNGIDAKRAFPFDTVSAVACVWLLRLYFNWAVSNDSNSLLLYQENNNDNNKMNEFNPIMESPSEWASDWPDHCHRVSRN